ncbi:MAG: SgcJ/EcaC family oxidoreductase [Planctomycetota bacterium]|nr:SgcJ/EcaC family oxidoreductase [Planctomycetota bacterium]
MIRSTLVGAAVVLTALLASAVSAQQAAPAARKLQAVESAKTNVRQVAAQKTATDKSSAEKVAAERSAADKAAAAERVAADKAAAAQKAAPKKPVDAAGTKKPVEAKPEPKEESKSGATEVDHTADNEAITKVIDEFEKAYNDRDAKAIAALFTPEAQIIDEDGTTVQGREAIEKVFADLFEANPEAVIATDVSDLKYIGSNLAIETGRTTLIPSPGDTAILNDYSVVHVKSREGKWLMALARDTPAQTLDHAENLLPLAFLIGDWVDESPDAVVETRYEWSDGDKFIVGKFAVKMAGEEAFSGTQRIGWDPMAKKIRSWVFDSNGGFQEGVWTRVGDQWLVKYHGVNGEGEVTAGTSVMTLISDERWTWQSRDRIAGDELLDDTPEVQVVRKGPQPDVEEVVVVEEVSESK